jgi:hypothetical protein
LRFLVESPYGYQDRGTAVLLTSWCACCHRTWGPWTPMKLLPMPPQPGRVAQLPCPPPLWGPTKHQHLRETLPWMALLLPPLKILPLPWIPWPCANSSRKACRPCLWRYRSHPSNPRPLPPGGNGGPCHSVSSIQYQSYTSGYTTASLSDTHNINRAPTKNNDSVTPQRRPFDYNCRLS